MSASNAAHERLVQLIELKEAIADLLIETRHAASIHHARACKANTEAEFMPLINGSATKAAQPTTGTKPCK